jgi:hypothetical protein
MLSAVATLLLLMIALLAIPVTLSFRVSWRQVLQGDIRLRWLFGLVHIPIPLSSSAPPSAAIGEPAPKTNRPAKASRNKPNLSATIRNKPLRRRILRFIREFWQAVRKQDLRLKLRIGLGDPADTGQLWAIVGPLSGMLANTREASIELEPDFFDATFELDSSGKIRLIPLQMLYIILGLLLSPPVWRSMRQARAAA